MQGHPLDVIRRRSVIVKFVGVDVAPTASNAMLVISVAYCKIECKVVKFSETAGLGMAGIRIPEETRDGRQQSRKAHYAT
jgi:hypothetical protein